MLLCLRAGEIAAPHVACDQRGIARERIAGQGAAGSDRADYRIQELLTAQEIMAAW